MRTVLKHSTRRRGLLAILVGLIASIVVAVPALAGVGWCRADPVVRLNGTDVQIWVAIPEWTYEPATPLPPAAVTAIAVSTVQIASGATAAFDAARKDFVKLRQKVGYPYRVAAFRVVLGEPRIVFVTPFDSRAAFYGANAFMALVEKAGAQSEWQALQTRLSANMGTEWDSKVWNYNAAVSYLPQP
jgi:hypothetical protein